MSSTGPDHSHVPADTSAKRSRAELASRGSVSVVIPAHNEERSIGRLLEALASAPHAAASLEVVIVCNGCTDRTADVARGFGPLVQVVDTPTPSKALALREGDSHVRSYPRAYVDADVVIGAGSLLRLRDVLREGSFLACAPRRQIELTGASWVVRSYYAVWQRLPQVERGLFGRGVVMVSEEGHARLRELPEVLSDDLAMSEAFLPHERRVVTEAVVTIRPPRTARDLLRRRVRVVTGNVQADDHGLRRADARTSPCTLVRLGLSSPRLAAQLPVFVGVTLLARLLSRRAVRGGDFRTWQRDESSRS